jgi:signal transduction histidine kinase
MTAVDTTKQELEDRVRKLESVVQECERLTVANRYAAAIMHEVNNPLEALTNLSYLMRSEATTLNGLELLRLMDEQIAVLIAVTRPALTFHKDHRAVKDVDLVSLVGSVRKLYESRLAAVGLRLICRCPARVLCPAVGSELLQVLSNLLLNAMDAISQASHGSTIHIRVHQSKRNVCICVADDGPGIPKGVLERLGEAYATGKTNGTGLGLWISKKIVEKHNGVLRWRSSRGVERSGTIFRIILPCAASTT